MGILANSVLEHGGEVVGIITKLLNQTEGHTELSELIIVNSMQERKMVMANLSNGCISLPGGLGTLEEIFELWNASKLGIYKNPIALLNIDNFFDPLMQFMQNAIKQEFLKWNILIELLCVTHQLKS